MSLIHQDSHLSPLVKVMIHVSSLSCNFYIRHITELTWLFLVEPKRKVNKYTDNGQKNKV